MEQTEENGHEKVYGICENMCQVEVMSKDATEAGIEAAKNEAATANATTAAKATANATAISSLTATVANNKTAIEKTVADNKKAAENAISSLTSSTNTSLSNKQNKISYGTSLPSSGSEGQIFLQIQE